MDYDVVVAGAGPVGLMLACELRLGGVSVLVLERLAEPYSQLKAGAMGARSINAPSADAFHGADSCPPYDRPRRGGSSPSSTSPPGKGPTCRCSPDTSPGCRSVPIGSTQPTPTFGAVLLGGGVISRVRPGDDPLRACRGTGRGGAARHRTGRAARRRRRSAGARGRTDDPHRLVGRMRRRSQHRTQARWVRLPRRRRGDHRPPGHGGTGEASNGYRSVTGSTPPPLPTCMPRSPDASTPSSTARPPTGTPRHRRRDPASLLRVSGIDIEIEDAEDARRDPVHQSATR